MYLIIILNFCSLNYQKNRFDVSYIYTSNPGLYDNTILPTFDCPYLFCCTTEFKHSFILIFPLNDINYRSKYQS